MVSFVMQSLLSLIRSYLFIFGFSADIQWNITQPQSESEVTQSCPTLCDPVVCSPPGSSVHGESPARITGVPFPSPGDLPNPAIKSRSSLLAQLVKNLPAMQETPIEFLGWKDPLEKR